jgi:hypothetical protein
MYSLTSISLSLLTRLSLYRKKFLEKFGNSYKMINFAADNIVEPFNHQRKGHANEYKVSTNPHRVLGNCNLLVAEC